MSVTDVVRDIEALRISQRAAREGEIRERQGRQAIGLGRLKATGIIPASDGLFFAAGVVPVEPPDMTRQQVFATLRAGGSRDGLPAEYLRDYDVSKQPSW